MAKTKTKTIYLTNRALSTGIEAVSCELVSDELARIGDNVFVTIGNDAFLTLQEACADAEEKRLKKVEWLKDQLKKYNCMRFKR